MSLGSTASNYRTQRANVHEYRKYYKAGGTSYSRRSLPQVEFHWEDRGLGKLQKTSTNQGLVETKQGFIVMNCVKLILSTRTIKRRDSPLWAMIIVNSLTKRYDLSWSWTQKGHQKGQGGRMPRGNPGELDKTGVFPFQVEGLPCLTSLLLHINCEIWCKICIRVFLKSHGT